MFWNRGLKNDAVSLRRRSTVSVGGAGLCLAECGDSLYKQPSSLRLYCGARRTRAAPSADRSASHCALHSVYWVSTDKSCRRQKHTDTRNNKDFLRFRRSNAFFPALVEAGTCGPDWALCIQQQQAAVKFSAEEGHGIFFSSIQI